MTQFGHKQVLAVRKDLKMGKGKIVAQTGHAAVTAADLARENFKDWWRAWVDEGQCKVAVKVNSEKEILQLESEAKKMGLPTALIRDKGLTQLEPGTITCLGIGPAPALLVDKLTGKLPLL